MDHGCPNAAGYAGQNVLDDERPRMRDHVVQSARDHAGST